MKISEIVEYLCEFEEGTPSACIWLHRSPDWHMGHRRDVSLYSLMGWAHLCNKQLQQL